MISRAEQNNMARTINAPLYYTHPHLLGLIVTKEYSDEDDPCI